MCGIAGFAGPSVATAAGRDILRRMTDSLAHRGPDDEGEWLDAGAGVALGHRRLSIIDLSQEGHQPMACCCGRHVISYNGEIYNHAGIAGDLTAQGIRLRGHSDTEVLVEAICLWGLEATLERIEGMFAFGHWDSQSRLLHLVRDRIGIKPLYYGVSGDTFLFASELKALEQHPGFSRRINRDVLALFLKLTYIPPPLSIYEGIHKLTPGTYVTVSLEEGARAHVGQPVPYWSLKDVAADGIRRPLALSDDAAADHLEELLKHSVRDQMVADVPVGAFLSGGVDSSTVVSIMQAVSPKPVHTFSIGFRDAALDEAPAARAVAEHLGTQHSELYVTADHSIDLAPQLAEIWDEPFAEVSQIPMVFLSRMARKEVTVVLSGDGGDELFAGYAWYSRLRDLWRLNRAIPAPVRSLLAAGVRPVAEESNLTNRITGLVPRFNAGMAARNLESVLESTRPDDLYYALRSCWKDTAKLVNGASASSSPLVAPAPEGVDFADKRLLAMYLDTIAFLPEHPLMKVDKSSMSVGLEARVPLLDRDVVEFAWHLPIDQRVRGDTTKFLLRKVLYRHVPPELIERPKLGFRVPMGEWLRGPLRPWAESVLDPAKLRSQGYLDPATVTRTWRKHLAGVPKLTEMLWSVLVFQMWLEAHRLP